ncbi:methyl-accepting chemotaxis protein [Desulfobacula phenolica]|uniref:Methyl-accepting chemotaxis protein n=1 Tax=Desulfobacula phenolica TaxID=90732 RepID=A0A1H2IS92_9BACT|nr:methyl-accepting chemotaxis protein [Desulfobacula phenolica]SDU47009.1 methyl-accepting chemotaxis protein [Desulfobacula phenolica]
MNQKFFSHLSVTHRVLFVVLFVLFISLIITVLLLNGFVERQMRLTYTDSVQTLFNAFEDGVKGSLERGQMKNFQKLLHHQKEIKGVLGVNLYDKQGDINLSSNNIANETRLSSELLDQIDRSKTEQLIFQTDSRLTVYAPQWVVPDCIRCHPTWKNGDIGGVLSLTYNLDSLNNVIDRLKYFTAGGSLILLFIVSIIIFLVMRKMVSNPINSIINNLSTSAKSVGEASHMTASSSESLSKNASLQASSLEQTSASLKKLAEMTHMNTENAALADNIMSETSQVMIDSNQTMDGLNNAMKKIEEANKETASTLKLIDEIAFQTNLLALNAAVEAARAGEAGAGFAVVADEVRNLALRSSKAANTINVLIKGSNSRVSKGVEFAQKAGESFGTSEKKTGEAVALINQIACASKDQSADISQLSIAVTELGKVTQNNLGDSNKASSVSSEMELQFKKLSQDVDSLIKLIRGESVFREANLK